MYANNNYENALRSQIACFKKIYPLSRIRITNFKPCSKFTDTDTFHIILRGIQILFYAKYLFSTLLNKLHGMLCFLIIVRFISFSIPYLIQEQFTKEIKQRRLFGKCADFKNNIVFSLVYAHGA